MAPYRFEASDHTCMLLSVDTNRMIFSYILQGVCAYTDFCLFVCLLAVLCKNSVWVLKKLGGRMGNGQRKNSLNLDADIFITL